MGVVGVLVVTTNSVMMVLVVLEVDTEDQAKGEDLADLDQGETVVSEEDLVLPIQEVDLAEGLEEDLLAMMKVQKRLSRLLFLRVWLEPYWDQEVNELEKLEMTAKLPLFWEKQMSRMREL